eukprot:5961237-Pleurochrysis_carterae.AAC.2
MKIRLIQCRDLHGPDAPETLRILPISSLDSQSPRVVEKAKMCSNASRMHFQVSSPANVLERECKSRTGSSDAVQLGQYAPSRCLKRFAKFQWSAGSRSGAVPTYGLDDNCCNEAFQAGLAQER